MGQDLALSLHWLARIPRAPKHLPLFQGHEVFLAAASGYWVPLAFLGHVMSLAVC